MTATLIRLGLMELIQQRRQTLLMAGVVAVSLLAMLVLYAYREGLEDKYIFGESNFQVVQQRGTMGEMNGSRLPADAIELVLSEAVTLAAPMINTIIGTSPENAILLRGVPLDNYSQVESFRMVAGRPLQPGDSPRQAMIGIGLAESKGLGPGGSISIRGRSFTVIGVFSVDTYSDFEVWIPLSEAQRLLGWGQDVSVIIIPASEGSKLADALPAEMEIVPRGQAAVNLYDEWAPLFDLLGFVAAALGIAAASALTNMLWRLAWIRRRQMAILRSLGFYRWSLGVYLFSLGVCISILAFLLAGIGAFVFTEVAVIQSIGLSIEPNISIYGAAIVLITAVVIALAAAIMPAARFARLDLLDLLRTEV